MAALEDAKKQALAAYTKHRCTSSVKDVIIFIEHNRMAIVWLFDRLFNFELKVF